MRSAYDCQTCGACCIGGYDDGGGWADCTVEDVKRMSRATRAKLVRTACGAVIEPGVASNTAWYATPAMITEKFGKVCDFLRGTPGARVSCRIYETRPDVCRGYKPGSRECRDARQELGL